MGYAGKIKEKNQALKLRKQGLSYNEIREKIPVSKDTLSRWCRDIVLSPGHMEKLLQKRLKVRKAIGFKLFLRKAGSSFYVCTARLSHG